MSFSRWWTFANGEWSSFSDDENAMILHARLRGRLSVLLPSIRSARRVYFTERYSEMLDVETGTRTRVVESLDVPASASSSMPDFSSPTPHLHQALIPPQKLSPPPKLAPRWFYDGGKDWTPYTYSSSRAIEQAHSLSLDSVTIATATNRYYVCPSKGFQLNASTGTRRRILRGSWFNLPDHPGGNLRPLLASHAKIIEDRLQAGDWHPESSEAKLPDGRLLVSAIGGGFVLLPPGPGAKSSTGIQVIRGFEAFSWGVGGSTAETVHAKYRSAETSEILRNARKPEGVLEGEGVAITAGGGQEDNCDEEDNRADGEEGEERENVHEREQVVDDNEEGGQRTGMHAADLVQGKLVEVDTNSLKSCLRGESDEHPSHTYIEHGRHSAPAPPPRVRRSCAPSTSDGRECASSSSTTPGFAPTSTEAVSDVCDEACKFSDLRINTQTSKSGIDSNCVHPAALEVSNFSTTAQAESRPIETEAARPLCRPSERDVAWVLEFREAVNSPGWTTVREEAGVRISSRSEGRMTLVKGVGELDASVKDVFDYLRDVRRNQKHMDRSSYGHRLITSFDDWHNVWYSAHKMPWPFADRDCVWESADIISPQEDEATCIGRSTKHPDAPPRAGRVRIEMLHSGFALDLLASGACSVTFLAQGDPKAPVPAWALSNATVDQASKVVSLKRHFESTRRAKQRGQNGD